MSEYFEYASKASICLAIIFLFYALLLKQTTYYIWNRYFLLLFSILSLVVPFINVDVFVEPQQLDYIPLVNHIPIIASNKIQSDFNNNLTTLNYRQLLLGVYFFISLILFIRLLVQLLSIRKIRSKAIPILTSGVKIYHLSEPVLPFSFLNSIFINKDNYDERELQKILDHELVHVQQNHTIDVLITEMICIFNWYNPFVWFIKKAVRENLEFIADNAVIRNGVDRKNYQYLLLKVTGNISSSITSNLKFTSLKSRIRMMNKTKTGKLHLLKFTLVVPLVTFLLLAFRNEHQVHEANSTKQNAVTKTYILSSLTYSVPDKKVEAVVKKEKENSLLKTGEALNLEMVVNEKNRLKNLLEKNGYDNIDAHAITFIIDTTLGSNSFSIQVNINLAKNELSRSEGEYRQNNNKISTQINSLEKPVQAINPVSQSYPSQVSNKDKPTNSQMLFDSKFPVIK